jgi:hypothetical protein
MLRFAVASVALIAALIAVPALADGIGVIAETSGEARLLRGSNYLEAAKGVEIEPADIIETGKNATVQVDMEDGSVLRIGPGSRLALTEYQLDQDKSVLSAGIDLLAGWLRFAVSKLKKTDASYQINAPVLTIGIRGTEGVIEAENEQGGLHLVSGAVEVSGEDAAGQRLAPVRVNAGEYVQRLRGQHFRKQALPPAAFQKRLPPAVQHKLARQAHALKQRGVPPRVIRQITAEDAKEFIRKHPHAEDRLKRRFKPVIEPGASREFKPAVGGLAPRDLKVRDPKDMKEISDALRKRYAQPPPGAPGSVPKPPLSGVPPGPMPRDRLAPIAPQGFPQKPAIVPTTVPPVDPAKSQ